MYHTSKRPLFFITAKSNLYEYIMGQLRQTAGGGGCPSCMFTLVSERLIIDLDKVKVIAVSQNYKEAVRFELTVYLTKAEIRLPKVITCEK